MFEILIPIIGGLALVFFILWENFKPEKPVDRALMERGFEPGASSKENILLVLGAVGICFGLYQFENPPHPPFTGHGSVISSILYAILGPLGEPGFIVALSIAAVIGAFVVRKRRLGQERKSDAG